MLFSKTNLLPNLRSNKFLVVLYSRFRRAPGEIKNSTTISINADPTSNLGRLFEHIVKC